MTQRGIYGNALPVNNFKTYVHTYKWAFFRLAGQPAISKFYKFHNSETIDAINKWEVMHGMKISIIGDVNKIKRIENSLAAHRQTYTQVFLAPYVKNLLNVSVFVKTKIVFLSVASTSLPPPLPLAFLFDFLNPKSFRVNKDGVFFLISASE